MNILLFLFGALSITVIGLWIAMFVATAKMTRHTMPGVSHFYLLTHVFVFFTGSKFLPSATPVLRRFRILVAALVVAISLAIIVGIFAYAPDK